MTRHRPVIADRTAALAGGVTLITLGSLLLWDAYEARGIGRPFVLKFLPGA